MAQVVVMVEEGSMEIVAKEVAIKLGLRDVAIVIPHQGKSDLEASFPRKLKAWSARLSPRFVICRDNDGGDCGDLKRKLLNMVPVEVSHPFKIRVVVQELESWYLGDLTALERAGLIGNGQGGLLGGKRKFRNPEQLTNAKQEFHRLTKQKGQLDLARRISPHLDLQLNACSSFRQFVSALRWASAD